MQSKKFDPYVLSKKIIEGVPVYYKNIPSAPCIHIRVAFHIGAFHDPVGKEGLSHFLEHMIFDGSKTLPDKKTIREWQKKYTVNTWNAWTSHHQTVYWCKSLPEHYTEVLRGMQDMIFNPLLRPEDVEHERGVITQEAWGRFHNEKFLQYIRECNNNLYPPHSNLRRFFSALGWPTTIKNITHSDIVTWHKNYGKNNMTLVVVGNVDQTTFSELKKFLKQAPPGKKYSLKKEKSVPPVSKEFRKHGDDIGDIREQAEINITRTHSPFSKQLYGTRYIFSRILKDILYEKIREERGLCYGLDFRISTTQTYADVGFNVTTDEKNIETIIEQFWSIVHDIQKGIYKKRFDNIKNMLIEKERSAEVLSYDIANDALEQILKYDGEIITSAETVTMLKKTTYADIVAFSKKVLDKKYIFTEIILPSKKTK